MDTAFNQIQNFVDQNTNGVDIEAKLRIPQTGFGDLTFTYNATYIFQQEQKLTFIPGQQWQSTVGTYATFGPVQRYRHYLVRYVATTGRGPSRSATTSRAATTTSTRMPTVRSVTWMPGAPGTCTARWTGVKNLALVAGITNLFNNTPPTTNQQDYFQIGYDPSVVEPAGSCVLPDGAVQVPREHLRPVMVAAKAMAGMRRGQAGDRIRPWHAAPRTLRFACSRAREASCASVAAVPRATSSPGSGS